METMPVYGSPIPALNFPVSRRYPRVLLNVADPSVVFRSPAIRLFAFYAFKTVC